MYERSSSCLCKRSIRLKCTQRKLAPPSHIYTVTISLSHIPVFCQLSTHRASYWLFRCVLYLYDGGAFLFVVIIKATVCNSWNQICLYLSWSSNISHNVPSLLANWYKISRKFYVNFERLWKGSGAESNIIKVSA
jgi:hypothetical protein